METRVYKVRGSHRTEREIKDLLGFDPNIHAGMAGKGAFCLSVTPEQHKLLTTNDIKIGKKFIR